MSFLRQSNKNAVLSVVLVLAILLSSAVSYIIKKKVIDSIPTISENSGKCKTVILDAGHGGEDCGAIGATGVYEKDLNMDISLSVGKMLCDNGYNVIYTRTEDKLLYTDAENVKGIRKISDLKNRVKIAEQNPDAIFVSIHMNSFGDSKYSGLQVYYGVKNDLSCSLAKSVQTAVHDMLQPENNRKIKQGNNIYLLENINLPSVLIECGFLSNKAECEKLSEKEYQKSLSFSIVCGIIEYMSENSD